MSDTELPAVTDPSHWTATDAREALLGLQRVLRAVTVFAIRLIEVSRLEAWRIEVVANTGTATTDGLPLSSVAVVWLREAEFEFPGAASH